MPARGEVWLVDLRLAQKTRPALVLHRECALDSRQVETVSLGAFLIFRC